MKIAIKGHELRGKEVIQILESLGGKNVEKLTGTYETFYYIDDRNEISDNYKEKFPLAYKFYTLEGFEEEFPFKIGDEVMFPVKTGWASGKITGLTYVGDQLKYEVDNRIAGYCYIEPRILQLYPMKEERNITLTLDKAKEWYKKGGELKEVALQAYSEEELTKVELPKTWEEFCDNYMIDDSEAYFDTCGKVYIADKTCRHSLYDRNVCPSLTSAEAHLAMIQLEQLRDCWRRGWVPTPGESYYVIKLGFKGLDVYRFCTVEFLSFPTRKMAEEFLKCFRGLIEKAGDLI